MNVQVKTILLFFMVLHEANAQCRVYVRPVTQCITTTRPIVGIPTPPPPLRRTVVPTPPPPSPPDDQWSFGKTVRIPLIKQVSTNGKWDNACGQYVIAATLSAFGNEITSAEYDRIGRSVNADQTGVSTAVLTEFLDRYAKTATPTGDFTKLQRQIDRGLPAILAVKVPSGNGHWIMVAGYTSDGEGQPIRWQIVDNGVLNGEVEHDELARMWRDYGHEMVLVEPRGSYPRRITDRLLANTKVVQPTPVKVTPPVREIVKAKPKPPQPVRTFRKDDDVQKPVSLARKPTPVTNKQIVSSSSSKVAARISSTQNAAIKPELKTVRTTPSTFSLDKLMPPGSGARLFFCLSLIALPTGGLMLLFFGQRPARWQGA